MATNIPRNFNSPGFNKDICEVLRSEEALLMLASNYFPIGTAQLKGIHHYAFKLEYDSDTDVHGILASRLPPYEVSKLVRDLFKAMLSMDMNDVDPFIVKNSCLESVLFDDYKNVYLTENLESFNIGMNKEDFDQILWSKLSTDATSITFHFEYKSQIHVNLSSLKFLKFMHILTWQSMLDDNSCVVVQNKNYKEESANPFESYFHTNEVYNKNRLTDDVGIKDPRVARSGYSKRIIVTSKNTLYLQIPPKIELFYPQRTLFLYLKQKYCAREEQDLASVLSSRQTIEEVEFQIKDLTVQDHFTNRVFDIKELSKRRAEKVKMDVDSKRTTVVDFYNSKYKVKINGRLPCVVDPDQNLYYSLEHLVILDYQRCEGEEESIEKQNEDRVCVQNYSAFTNSLKNCTIIGGLKPYLDAFGIVISTKCANVEGRQLLPPLIKYRNSEHEINPDSLLPWKTENTSLFKEAKQLKWVVVDWNAFETDKQQTFFIRNLHNAARHLNVDKPAQRRKVSSGSLSEEIEEMMKELIDYDVIVFVVNIERYKNFRTLLKFHELGSQAITVCVSLVDAKCKKFEPVMSKIIHKLNSRTGGINFEFLLRNEYSDNLRFAVTDRWINKQFIGVHCRRLDSFCMAISVAYTINTSCNIRGEYFIEQVGSSSSNSFDEALLQALCEFQGEADEAPREVFLYTQITKEDDVQQWIQWLKDSCQGVLNKYKARLQTSTILNFVIITVQIDCGDALFLAMGSRRNADRLDLPVGTCVDKTIVCDKSFMLIQARKNHASSFVSPSHFTIYNDSVETFSKEEVEYFTYYLCACNPTECRMSLLPLPLRAASDFTKRAYSNLKALKLIMSDDDYEPSSKRSRISSMPDPYESDIPDELTIARLNAMLKPNNKQYFCA